MSLNRVEDFFIADVGGSEKRPPRTSGQKPRRKTEASAVTGEVITGITTPAMLQERDTDAPEGAKLFEEKGRGSAMEELDAGPCP